MKSIEESVVTAMDGTDGALFPFLTYILQDVWEIGADPDVMTGLIRKHTRHPGGLKVLDPGCGKGAVSIRIAQELRCMCHGIDAVPEFIEDARKRAAELRVDRFCRFEVGDIRTRVQTLPRHDVIVLGSIGPVFGDYHTTLTTLSRCLDPDGLLIVDDGYIDDDSDFTHPLMLKREALRRQIQASGMRLIDEVVLSRDNIREADDRIFDCLKKRCLELMDRHPDKRRLFEDYIARQEEENDVLENRVICSTMAIKKT